MCIPFFAACTGQNAFQTIVAFVAGILVDQLAGGLAGKSQLFGKGLGVDQRVGNGDGIVDLVFANDLETLSQFQLVGGDQAEVRNLGPEVLRVDYQRVALPVADRVAKPGLVVTLLYGIFFVVSVVEKLSS